VSEPPKVVPLTYVICRKQFARIRGATSVDAALKIAEDLETEQIWSVSEFEYVDTLEEQE